MVAVAVIQPHLAVGDVAGNRQHLDAGLDEAVTAGARIVVHTELAPCGYVFDGYDELLSVAETVDGPTITGWAAAAERHDLVIAGGFAERCDGHVHNSAVIVDATGVRAVYRKAHLWDTEKLIFTPGDDLPPVVDTVHGRIGLMICYDMEFPEWVRAVALRGAQLLAVPTNWPAYPIPDGQDPEILAKIRANASINHMAVAAADRVGDERGVGWLGRSTIVDADGYYLAGPASVTDPAVLVAQVDLTASDNKQISPRNNLITDRRPELYARAWKERP